MILKKWEELPDNMRNEEVKKYYDVLSKKKFSLFMKRLFDMVVSFLMLIVVSPFFLILAIVIKLDSKGPVFYRQVRVTQYGKEFRIHKFRSMVQDADKKGSLVTINNDTRITRIGKFIRKFKLDEVSQLIDVLQGTMSFVGMRPEVPKYVAHYTNEMMATLLLPAGVTSEVSIKYKDEAKFLDAASDIDKIYLEIVLPDKMKYGLKAIEDYSFWKEIGTMFKTVLEVF